MKKLVTGGLALGLAFTLGACGGPANDKGTAGSDGRGDYSAASSHNRPITGAIFTTDENGDAVNKNHYEEKEDVYLNGGPRKEGAAGLPDGDYYYQITDPGCKELLAGPGADSPYNTSAKIITVVDGEFTDLMQLAPFADTPNNGGVYKVMVTPVDKWVDPAEGCFGFEPRFSKFDVFKVDGERPEPPEDTYCISGTKRYDPSLGEAADEDLDGLGGILIELYDDEEDLIESTYTDSDGEYEFCGLENGDYKVVERLPDGNGVLWFAVGPDDYEVIVDDEDVEDRDFRNVCFLKEGEDFRGEPKGVVLDLIFAALEGSGLFSHPLIVAAFGGEIETIVDLRDFLALDDSNLRVAIAQLVVNLAANIALGNLDADLRVLAGTDLGDIARLGDLFDDLAAELAGHAELSTDRLNAIRAILHSIWVLQDEPCTPHYNGGEET